MDDCIRIDVNNVSTDDFDPYYEICIHIDDYELSLWDTNECGTLDVTIGSCLKFACYLAKLMNRKVTGNVNVPRFEEEVMRLNAWYGCELINTYKNDEEEEE